MATQPTATFLAGVVEGFYGPPWTPTEHAELFSWLSQWGLNTYLYAPKDDLKHRALWRDPYTEAEAEALGEIIRGCTERQVQFIYALSPGLDLVYGDEQELSHLRRRFDQLMGLGCRHFGLLFDDVPDRPDTMRLVRAGRLAGVQSAIANQLFDWVRQKQPEARFLFCPAPYCGRMAERGIGGPGYLAAVGRELLPDIDVLWTGPEIISEQITVAHLREVQSWLRRKPVLWDNLHANDYDGRRFFCGPYAGRPPVLRDEVGGILANPNTEFPLNYVPLRTLALFLSSEGPWDARQAYLSALRDWSPRFLSVGSAPAFEDLVRFTDCFYLPHEDGPEAGVLYQLAGRLLTAPPDQWGVEASAFLERAGRLKAFCGHLPELRDRPLFHALNRRVWELREELDLLELYVRHQAQGLGLAGAFQSDFHLPRTYRGGLVARLQRLLFQHADGTFTHNTQSHATPFGPRPACNL